MILLNIASLTQAANMMSRGLALAAMSAASPDSRLVKAKRKLKAKMIDSVSASHLFSRRPHWLLQEIPLRPL
jgi:hypothetical protein